MTPKPMSHSTLVANDTCSRQYCEIKVLHNFQDKKNDASIWGEHFHEAAEHYLDGSAPLPADMEPYRAYLDSFLALPGNLFTERLYAIDQHGKPCGFYDEGVRLRGIIDILVLNGRVARVEDHKTGKRKKDMQQLIIFALLVFYHHPEVDTVHTAFHWLKDGSSDTETFYRHSINKLWDSLMPTMRRYVTAFESGIFPPKKSGLCKAHCPVDTCEFHGGGR